MRGYSRRTFLFIISSFFSIFYNNKVFGNKIDNGVFLFFGDLSVSDLTISSYDQVISVNGKFYKLNKKITGYSIPMIVSISQWGSHRAYFKELSAKEGSYVDFSFYNKKVTPEIFGAIGNGTADDTVAMTKCFSIKNDIVLRENAIYRITSKITVSGAIMVDARNASIKCDGCFMEVIDGGGSIWNGGKLITDTVPYTVIYDSRWNIIQQGIIGDGRMPFRDEKRIPAEYQSQMVGCAIIFRSSTQNVQHGLLVQGLSTNYGNVIVAGFDNCNFINCNIKGGNHIGGISIMNGTREPLLWAYSTTDINPFVFCRGKNHKILNCVFQECNNNGLYLSGSDNVVVEHCQFINNGESGIKTAQYIKRTWASTACCCVNVFIKSCISSGQYYDGFDVQNAYGSGSYIHLNSFVNIENCITIKNYHAGIVSQGGGNVFKNCFAELNGSHGIISKESENVQMLHCQAINNGQFFGGVELTLIGPGSVMRDCLAIHTLGNRDFMIINQQTGSFSKIKTTSYSINNRVSDKKKCIISVDVDIKNLHVNI
ncbi:right-handed parallel beta-helix repeat-containing protein [Klebsiella aerogenes]|uniref:right-handed parallel beta-helix repeat-containing protein n=1 Tax=Klebsiella aerogenes TaxID=548 RepID=UPI0035170B74|nr:right-handed parallel beta-helix repeat-containing protein [Klebsiella aerogenes]